jgi:hypothetical protein
MFGLTSRRLSCSPEEAGKKDKISPVLDESEEKVASYSEIIPRHGAIYQPFCSLYSDCRQNKIYTVEYSQLIFTQHLPEDANRKCMKCINMYTLIRRRVL